MGYRGIRDELGRNHNIYVNDKRILRIDRALHIQSTIKFGWHRFTSQEQIVQAISDRIFFYNNQRLQRRLSVMTPMEFHEQYSKAAKKLLPIIAVGSIPQYLLFFHCPLDG